MVDFPDLSAPSASKAFSRESENLNPTNRMRATSVGAFILPPRGRFPAHPMFCRQTCDRARQSAMDRMHAHCVTFRSETAINRPVDRGAKPVKSATPFGINSEPDSCEEFGSRIRGLRIAIYSLTESSSRQAKAAIEEVAPTAIVDYNADHGGTARLRSLAENSDLFVMTWLSAKHAATDFVREHRGGRPLLYAQGRGFSSILRAVEDYTRRL
jgi:hypothetical protein